MTPDTLVPTGTAEPALLDLQFAEPPDLFTPQPTPPTSPEHRTPHRPRTAPHPAAAGQPPAEPDDPLPADTRPGLPGSTGEHLLQCAFGTEQRANRFYADQVLDRLNERMIEFVGRMTMAFVGTADSRGDCDVSFRAGPPGFLHVLDERTLAYPEYRGNGVLASLGNISENPRVGLLLVDFVTDLIGLHVNGEARIVDDADLRAEHPDLPSDHERGRTPERWVRVDVHEAYIHCRKHLPRMVPVDRTLSWGSDDALRKGGDFFAAKGMSRPWTEPASTTVESNPVVVESGASGR